MAALLQFVKDLFNRNPELTAEDYIQEQPELGEDFPSGNAVVDTTIQPGKIGRVQFEGSGWFARCERDVVLVPGRVVNVVGVRNVTLLVEPQEGA
jgi:membrane protein implicated in regulation of membrane protease activity